MVARGAASQGTAMPAEKRATREVRFGEIESCLTISPGSAQPETKAVEGSAEGSVGPATAVGKKVIK